MNTRFDFLFAVSSWLGAQAYDHSNHVAAVAEIIFWVFAAVTAALNRSVYRGDKIFFSYRVIHE